MNTDQSLATTEQPQQVSIVRTGERGVQFSTLGEMQKFALVAVNSGIYKDLTPAQAIIKIQAGMELGLSPVWSLKNIYTVNGKPHVYGDALLGIVLGNPLCEDVIETIEGEGDKMTARCEVRRKGRQPVIRTFSVADAKAASLWGKAGPWAQYKQRMLAMRARSFACRDAFADSLSGIGVKEELDDIPRANVRELPSAPADLRFADEPSDAPTVEAVGATAPETTERQTELAKEDLFV